MKKLTPFQKKVARWYVRLPKIMGDIIFSSFIPLMILACVFGLLGLADWKGQRVNMLITSGSLLVFSIVLPYLVLAAAQWRWQLPEICQKDAEALVKEHPEFSDILGPLIQESVVSDDRRKLAEKLDEINNFLSLKEKLVSKREYLKELQKEILEIEKKIAALEKELGLGGEGKRDAK